MRQRVRGSHAVRSVITVQRGAAPAMRDCKLGGEQFMHTSERQLLRRTVRDHSPQQHMPRGVSRRQQIADGDQRLDLIVMRSIWSQWRIER